VCLLLDTKWHGWGDFARGVGKVNGWNVESGPGSYTGFRGSAGRVYREAWRFEAWWNQQEWDIKFAAKERYGGRRKRNITKMKRLIFLLFAAQALNAQTAPTPKPETGEQHEFVIANFHTERGATLPQARIVYGTYGHLNAAKDNVVLLPSHYLADFHGYE
jgi:hypothetical protein